MAHWRKNLVVQDSDDESDGALSTQSFEGAPHPRPHFEDGFVDIEDFGSEENELDKDTTWDGEGYAELQGSERGPRTEVSAVNDVEENAPGYAEDDSEDELSFPAPKITKDTQRRRQEVMIELLPDGSNQNAATGLPAPKITIDIQGRRQELMIARLPDDDSQSAATGSTQNDEEVSQSRLEPHDPAVNRNESLQSHDNNLQEANNRPVSLSLPSSPLTEPSKSPSPDPQFDLEQPLPIQSTDNAQSIPPLEDGPSLEPAQESVPPRHWSFRRRRQEQLQPYTVEDARHRRTFQNGGLKPIRYREVDVDVQRGRKHKDGSPDASYEAEETQLASDGMGHGASLSNSQPSLDSDPRASQTEEYSKNGNKRRKLAQTTPKKTSKGVRMVVQVEVPAARHSLSPIRISQDMELDMFDVPPSPDTPSLPRPRSTQVIENGFRYPPGIAPPSTHRQLPTPDKTSDPRTSGSQQTDSTGGNNDQNVQGSGSDQGNDTDDSETEDVDQDQDHDESQIEQKEDLSRVKRNIKGVLPASWIRMDQQKQDQKVVSNKDKGQRISNSSSQAIHRGVARPISSHRPVSSSNQTRLNDSFFVSDGELSDPLECPMVRKSPPSQRAPSHVDKTPLPIFVDDDDSMEDNDIDRMLPRSESNPRAKRTYTRKGSGRKSGATSIFKDNNISRVRQTKISGHVTHQRSQNISKPRKRCLPMGIADVVDADKLRQAPNFLRLATRTASARPDRGRGSPTRKVLKLATREDTTDVNGVLNEWRANRMPRLVNSVAKRRQQRSKVSKDRYPLTNLSTNTRVASTPQVDNCPSNNARQAIIEILKQSTSRIAGSSGPQKLPLSTVTETEKIKAILSSNLTLRHDNMPALLEQQRSTSQRPRPLKRTKSVVQPVQPRATNENPVLERYFEASVPSFDQPLPKVNATNPVQTQRLQRKRPPRQFQVSSSSWLDTVNVDELDVQPSVEHERSVVPETSSLTDFASYGSEYTIDFDTKPLPTGAFFPKSPILGNGCFERCLRETASRNYRQAQDALVFRYGENTYRWGAWTETVSSELLGVFRDVTAEFNINGKNSDALPIAQCLLVSLSDYLSNHLFFYDMVDRFSFASRFNEALSEFNNALVETTTALLLQQSLESHISRELLEVVNRTCILSWQLFKISQDNNVPEDQKRRADTIARKAISFNLRTLLHEGISDFDKFLRTVWDYSTLAAPTSLPAAKVESLVICLHLLKDLDPKRTSFWETLNTTAPLSVPHGVRSIRSLEHKWFNLFVLLPLFDIDATGQVTENSRDTTTVDNWSSVKSLLQPVLEQYEKGFSMPSLTFNDYCRALLGRCICLVRDWHWRNCESILRRWYDFFASNNLGNLRNEDSLRSPSFLEELGSQIDLVYQKEDKSFNLFLKLLVTGLHNLQLVVPDKKIQSIVWRITPNHSRSLPKDQAVRQEDLDALRNHQNLLTILYSSSPPGKRPRLDTLRQLVRVDESHRQACQINIQAWSNLMQFQLSQEEPSSILGAFMDWFGDFFLQTITQHKLARVEAEVHGGLMSAEDMEACVAANQREVEATIADALQALRRAISSARTYDTLNMLLSGSLQEVFGLFDSKTSRTNKVIINAVDVVLDFVRFRIDTPSIETSEDSQDFGTPPPFDAEFDETGSKQGIKLPLEVYQSVHALLSNCFGAETAPDDALLAKLVETWVAVANLQVQTCGKLWSNYVDPYGQDSWESLRNTEQRMLYTPLFYAKVIELDHEVYEEHKSSILRSWLTSLVARESQLKFQNVLTSILLSRDPKEPLFNNLPFARDENEKIEINANDFSARRLSLISSILANMRQSLDSTHFARPSERAACRQEYASLLKTLMKTMQETYESLGNGADIQEAYVKFVQTTVSFLQQYTTDIQPIDRFFMDSRTFPLPANDPTYIVGHLKSYGLKLSDLKVAKQLVMFLQNVTERAVIDAQQDYLVDQLQAAMSKTFEHGNMSRPTLRSYLVQSILPVYVEAIPSTSYGWLLAAPLLQSLQGTLDLILTDLNGFDPDSLRAVTATITSVLTTMQHFLLLLVDHPEHLDHAHVLRIMTILYAISTSALSPLDYCISLGESVQELADKLINYLLAFARFANGAMDGTFEFPAPKDIGTLPAPSNGHNSIRNYATKELESTLEKNWKADAGVCWFVRGGKHTRIEVDLLDIEGERLRWKLQWQMFLKQVRHSWFSESEQIVHDGGCLEDWLI